MEDRWIFENGIYRKATEEEIAEIESGPEYIPPPTKEEQAVTFMRAMARTAANIPDAVALSIPNILPTWQEFLDADEKIEAGICLMYEGQCYRTKQAVPPQAHQPPGSEGMLAIYSPIDREHAGTIEDPIPWVSGMDCYKDKYYLYNGKTYLCTQDMKPCTWEPGSDGVWQWEEIL